MALSIAGPLPWQAGPPITGLSAGIPAGAAPVTSNIFQNPVYSAVAGFTELSVTADILLQLNTAETATAAGGWIGLALLKFNAVSGPGEVARVNGTQLFPYDGNRYAQINIVPSAAYTATEWLTVGRLTVPRSPYLGIAAFNNSSFAIPSTAAWIINFNFDGIG